MSVWCSKTPWSENQQFSLGQWPYIRQYYKMKWECWSLVNSNVLDIWVRTSFQMHGLLTGGFKVSKWSHLYIGIKIPLFSKLLSTDSLKNPKPFNWLTAAVHEKQLTELRNGSCYVLGVLYCMSKPDEIWSIRSPATQNYHFWSRKQQDGNYAWLLLTKDIAVCTLLQSIVSGA